MADGQTTNYGFTQPEVGASTGTWGSKLNAALASVDASIKAREDGAAAAQATADAALPKAGGTMTGRLVTKTSLGLLESLGNLSGAESIDLTATDLFEGTVTGATTFAFVNAPSGGVAAFLLRLVNGGSAAVTWPGSVRWPGGVSPTLTASGTDLLMFVSFDDGTTWLGVAALNLA